MIWIRISFIHEDLSAGVLPAERSFLSGWRGNGWRKQEIPALSQRGETNNKFMKKIEVFVFVL